MATTLENKLAGLKAQVSNLEYELSNEVKAKKIALSDELCRLLDDGYNGAINIYNENVIVEGEFVEFVFACEYGDSFVENENGEQFYFLDHLTLSEVENIVAAVKETIEDIENDRM